MNQQCSQCQAELKPGSRFCGKCGMLTELSKPTISQPSSQEQVSAPSLQSQLNKTATPSIPLQKPTPSNTAPQTISPGKSFGFFVLCMVIAVCIAIAFGIKSNLSKSANPVAETLIPIVGTYVHHDGSEIKTLTFSADNLVVSANSSSSKTTLLHYERNAKWKQQVNVLPSPSKDGANRHGEWHQFFVSSDDRLLSDLSTGAKYVRQGNY